MSVPRVLPVLTRHSCGRKRRRAAALKKGATIMAAPITRTFGRTLLAVMAALALSPGTTGATDEPRGSADDLARFARGHRGDTARGRDLFHDPKRAGCARCHKARGQGGEIGPDLSDVGGKLDREALIEAVLEPSRQIVEGYRPSALALADGRVLPGLVRDEPDGRVSVVEADGRRVAIERSD